MNGWLSKYIILSAFAVITPYAKILASFSLLNLLVAMSLFSLFFTWHDRLKIFDKNLLCVVIALFYVASILLISGKLSLWHSFFWSFGLLLYFAVLFSTPPSLIRFAKYYVYIVCCCLIIALFQFFGFDWAWEARSLFGIPDDTAVLDQIKGREKSVGLAYYSVQFSYQLLVAFYFTLFVFHRNVITSIICLFLIFLGALATGSLSLFVIFTTSCVYLYFRFLKKYIAIITILFLFVILQSTLGDRIVNLHQDSGFTSRLALTYIAINMASAVPIFGYSSFELDQQKHKLAIDYGASEWVQNISFHNSFITTLLQSGWFVLFLYLFIFYLTLRLSIILASTSLKNANILFNYRAFPVAVLGYMAESSFHNAGIQTGDVYGWMLIAFIISVYRQQMAEKII